MIKIKTISEAMFPLWCVQTKAGDYWVNFSANAFESEAEAQQYLVKSEQQLKAKGWHVGTHRVAPYTRDLWLDDLREMVARDREALHRLLNVASTQTLIEALA